MNDEAHTAGTAAMPAFWTRQELAAVLQVSCRTIDRLVAASLFPAPFRVGRGLRWSPAVIEKFVCQQEIGELAAKS